VAMEDGRWMVPGATFRAGFDSLVGSGTLEEPVTCLMWVGVSQVVCWCEERPSKANSTTHRAKRSRGHVSFFGTPTRRRL
jgi:hypothetical protein